MFSKGNQCSSVRSVGPGDPVSSGLPPWNPTISDPASVTGSLPVSQLRWWLARLITTGLSRNPNQCLKMHVSSAWAPLVTASGRSVVLRSLWKQCVSLNKSSASCNSQRSWPLILRCEGPLWQTCHYKRDIKHHKAPSALLRAAVTLNTAAHHWKWYCVQGSTTAILWFPASVLMWSGRCGFRGQTRATANLVWDLIPSQSQQDVFNEPQSVPTVTSHP